MVKGTGEGKYHRVSDFARKDLGEVKMYLHLFLTQHQLQVCGYIEDGLIYPRGVPSTH